MTIVSVICLFFCVGIIAESFLGIGFKAIFFLSGLAMVLSITFLRSKKVFYPVLYFLFFVVGALAYANASFLTQDSMKKMEPFLKRDILISGRVADDPYRRKGKSIFVLDSVRLQACQSKASIINGTVLVEDNDASNSYVFDQELVLKGRLSQRFGYARFFKRREGAYIFRVSKQGLLLKHFLNKRNFFKEAAFSLKHKSAFFIARDMSPEYASFLRAMFLGERSEVPIGVKDMLIKIGVWHVLVVSGSHVVLIMSMMWLVLKAFFVPRRARACLTIGGLWFYCFLTGCSVSVLRAVAMASFFLAGSLLERKPHFYNTFSLAVFVILMINPFQFFDIGFQLSFLSVFFIVWLSPKLKTIFPAVFFEKMWSRCLIEYFCVATGAWVGTAPILIFYFGTFTWLAVLANMIIVPLSALIVSSAFVLVCLEAIFRPAAYFVACGSSFFILLFLKFSYFLSALPFGYVKGARLPFAAVVGCYVLIACFGLFLGRRRKAL